MPMLLTPLELRVVSPALRRSRLYREHIIAMAEAAARARCHLDLRGYDLDEVDLSSHRGEGRRTWRGLIFGINHQAPTASISRMVFRDTNLHDCRFAGVQIEGCDFTECAFVDCDFRYTQFRRARIGSTTFVGCDFYGAAVEAGTIATNIHFTLSSIPQFGDGVTGLDWSCVESSDGVPAHVGERADAYKRFLKRTEKERPKKEGTVAGAIDRRVPTAAGTYRRLSGYWASQGQFREANLAYTHSRRLERRAASPWYAIARRVHGEGTFGETRDRRGEQDDREGEGGARGKWASALGRWRGRMCRPITWLGLWIADLVTRFGQSLTRVAAMLLAIAILPGLAYSHFHGVYGARDLWDDLLFSAARLTAYTPQGLAPATKAVEWIGVIQSIVGIGLIGLFGYVLGNVLRQS